MTRRRQLLKAGALGATASFTTGAYAQTQPSVRWRMAALYPRSLDTCYGSTEQMCKRVAELTNGKFTITLHPPGDLVPPLQVLDAVSAGTVEAGQVSGTFYFGKNPALMFESGLPFGMNARQQNAWLYEAGGLKEVQKVFAGFNCHSVPCGNFGTQMGGWFRKEINSLKDLSGLKMRIGGFGGQVISRLGVVPQMIPGGDLYAALEKGVIDAAEFVGPYDDEKLGLAKVTQYYYSPGWWEGGSAQVSAIANQKACRRTIRPRSRWRRSNPTCACWRSTTPRIRTPFSGFCRRASSCGGFPRKFWTSLTTRRSACWRKFHPRTRTSRRFTSTTGIS
jgi:TRAP-type mannitol/chloroaromatic compound transport system substrate-binding protein